MKTILLLTVLILYFSCSKKVVNTEIYDVPLMEEESTKEPEQKKPLYVFESKKPDIIKTVVVYFDFGSYELKKSEEWKISSIETPIELIGGCSPEGTEYYNYSLGLNRCKAVIKYFYDRGISVNKYKSVGERELVTYDKDKYELNRRCEIKYK